MFQSPLTREYIWFLLNMTSKFLYVISHCFSHNRSNYHNTSTLPNKTKQDEKHEIKIQMHIDAQKKKKKTERSKQKKNQTGVAVMKYSYSVKNIREKFLPYPKSPVDKDVTLICFHVWDNAWISFYVIWSLFRTLRLFRKEIVFLGNVQKIISSLQNHVPLV